MTYDERQKIIEPIRQSQVPFDLFGESLHSEAFPITYTLIDIHATLRHMGVNMNDEILSKTYVRWGSYRLLNPYNYGRFYLAPSEESLPLRTHF